MGFDVIFVLFELQYFSVKMMEGIVATSYAAGDKFYIDPRKLLPLARFLPQPKYVLTALKLKINLSKYCTVDVKWVLKRSFPN